MNFKMTENIKIYVCQHKDSVTLKDAVFTPIHVGKEKSKVPLNAIGDDTGDNISVKNPFYCELTAVYWAWKNDPSSDWIGLMHYRRYLNISQKKAQVDQHGCINIDQLTPDTLTEFGINAQSVKNLIKNNPSVQAILPKKWSVKKAGFSSLEKHYEKSDFHYKKDLIATRNIIKKNHPTYLENFDIALNDHEGYFTNMFILKKDLFNDYCDWLFSILFELEKSTDLTNYSNAAKRIYGYLSERLLNVFLLQRNLQKNQILELDRIFFTKTDPKETSINAPSALGENYISIVIASDNNFTPHLAALIESITFNISKEKNLDIIVLDGGINAKNKLMMGIQFSQSAKANDSLRFLDCSQLYRDIETHMHFSTSTFYRIGLDELLKNHDRVLYLDCDMIVMDDLSKLWDIDLDGKTIAAVPDVIMKAFRKLKTPAIREASGLPADEYVRNYVGLGDHANDYFQAGLILFDLKKYRESGIAKSAIQDLLKKKYWFLDQDILNKYLQGQVKLIDSTWNCVNLAQDVSRGLNAEGVLKIREDLANPKIIHYAGFEAKPWNNPNAPWAHAYWYYLRKTFWYEEVFSNVKKSINTQQMNNGMDAGLKRSFLYKIIRTVWRNSPEKLQSLTSSLAHKYVRKHSSQ